MTCPQCGLEADPGARFCNRCGTALAGGPAASERLVVRVDPERTPVAAGAAATAQVVVRNLGTLVEHADLALTGMAAPWCAVEPPNLRILPGEQAQAVLTMSPPRTATSAAGRHSLIVEAHGANDSGVTAHADTIVDVAPFDLVAARIVPLHATRWRGSARRLELTNSGNAPVQATLTVRDADDEMQFTGLPPAIPLPPGQPVQMHFAARAKRLRLLGGTANRDFTVTVATPGGSDVVVAAVLRQRAVITILTVLAAIVVLLFLTGVVNYLR